MALFFLGERTMSGNRTEPDAVVVAAPADRAPQQWTERDGPAARQAARDDEDEQRGDEIDEPGYGHGV
jgi:hypothetical protein